ncbi:galactoside alpha-(1,2)-fucosyltransferase 2-like [Saccostrea echinata]|uniref:galactoside alpha-(1,2)-fucosyltransferase 2-like n=1 Tax=Saccostrea echinata TaxID=191078 RepID=UPI002A7ECC55|nr:galactoside alpha-(1,2)-fucosyltransferase 2-like [Saccostrea echinata]
MRSKGFRKQFAHPSPKYQARIKSNTSNGLRRTGSRIGFLCGSVTGNLGNRLFVFASIYGIAKMKNITYFIPRHDTLFSVFNLFNDSHLIIAKDSRKCKGTFFRKERKCCGYDPKLLNFQANTGYTLITYLQSWKYFEGATKNLRKQLTFKNDIQLWVNHTLEKISKGQNYSHRDDVIFIGVHVRRGDMLTSVSAYGYQVATPNYLHRAINRFIHLPNVIYVVCSLEIQWVKQQLQNITNIYYSDPKHGAHKDLALLAACDHVITTVGTFGWWGGWLSSGNVTYFKWPAKPGSGLRKQFSKDYMDFFLPQWTGI